MKKPNRTTLLILILSLLLVFTGVTSLGFTYLLFPMLVPGYGGGEPFHLTNYNNYTTTFPWFSSSKLHLTIKANNTIQIYIDGKNVYNGTYYKLSIEPNNNPLITLKSTSPVTGRFGARQEPPWMMQIAAISLFLTGLISSAVSLTYWIWSRKKSVRESAADGKKRNKQRQC
ncbi:MAG: hypothetical protein ACXADY_07790 [Candidatus Hodarchaeales archaeon]